MTPIVPPAPAARILSWCTLAAACSACIDLAPVPAPSEQPMCDDVNGFAPQETLCLSDRDCAGGRACEGESLTNITCGRCVTTVCVSDADCAPPRDRCDVARGLCVAESCAEEDVCGPRSACVSTIAGAICEETGGATRCTLSPARALLVDGVEVRLDVVFEGAGASPIAVAPEDAAWTLSATGAGAQLLDVTNDGALLTGLHLVPRCDEERCAAEVEIVSGAAACAAELVILGPAPADRARVVVLGDDEAPVADADVTLRFSDDTVETLATDTDGVAHSAPIDDARSIVFVTAYARSYGAVTLVAPAVRDIGITLPRVAQPERMAGAVGSVDPANVIVSGDVILGSAGLPFLDLEGGLRGELLFGRPRVSFFDFGGDEPQPFVSMTGGTLRIGTQDTVPQFAAEGAPGRRFAWAFTGAVSLSLIGPALSAVDGGGPLSPIIELIRLVDERATFGLSSFVSSTWVARPEQNADYVTAGLVDAGRVAPDVFTGARVEVIVPPLPPPHDGVLLLALADTAGLGAVPIGARYLEDGDGDGVFEDDGRPIASGHDLYLSPPARALAGRPITFAVIATERALLEEAELGELRVFRTVPALPAPEAPLQIASAFPTAPSVTLDDQGRLTAGAIDGELVVRLSGEQQHDIVLFAAGEVDVAALDPALAFGALVSARASVVEPDWRAGARAWRDRPQRVRATTRVPVRSP